MQILVNTDNHIRGDERVQFYVEDAVRQGLGHFSDRLTRVEVHLKDVNAGKAGDNDKRCTMETRPEGRPPVAVTAEAAQLRDAIDGAAEKMRRALESSFGKLDDR